MKYLKNVNLATISDAGLDSAIVLTEKDKKVLSAIGHGLLALGYAAKAATFTAATAQCVKVAASKTEDPGTRVIAGCCGSASAIGAGVYGCEAVGEAKACIADAKEAMKG